MKTRKEKCRYYKDGFCKLGEDRLACMKQCRLTWPSTAEEHVDMFIRDYNPKDKD